MRKPISKRLKSVKSFQSQQIVLSDWVKNWRLDQETVIQNLDKAIKTGDIDTAFHMVRQLQGMTTKRFEALNTVFRIITDPERKLIDGEHIVIHNDSVDCNSRVEEKYNKKSDSIIIPDEKSTDKLKEIHEIDIEEIVKSYKSGTSVKEIAGWNNLGYQKIIKILVTEGVYSSDIYDTIKDLRLRGISEDEIMQKLDIDKKVLNIYTPYKKGIYNLKNPSKNAMNIRRYKERKNLGVDDNI